MLDGVDGIVINYVIAGCIWAIAMGFAAGNYACSLVHRLPRGRLLLDKTPYCGHCKTLLQVKDLFPVISAVLLKHRCRYCGEKFPVSHTWTEILVGVLFVLAYLQYNFAEQYILVVSIGVFLITLAAIEINEKMLMGRVLLCALVTGMIYRAMQDGAIYPFFSGGLFGLMIGVVLKYKEVKKEGHIYTLPRLALLLVCGGVCVGVYNLPTFLALFFALWCVFFVLGGMKKPALTIPFGFAVMWPVLYPGLSIL